MTVWKAEIPKKDYNVNLPYVPQIFGEVHQQITEIFKLLVELDTNGNRTFQVHHRGEMCVLLLKNDSDNYITKSIWEIKYRIYELLQKNKICITYITINGAVCYMRDKLNIKMNKYLSGIYFTCQQIYFRVYTPNENLPTANYFLSSTSTGVALYIGTEDELDFKEFIEDYKKVTNGNGGNNSDNVESDGSVFEEEKETELPSIHDFYSTLKGKITQANYEHAQKTAMHHYGLDLRAKIELFTDISMQNFTEKAKQEGIAMAGHHFLKANNPKIGVELRSG
ncbi:hypothetical protein RhiirC2_783101 [Rhizophagus irregularis]|uniref:Uncharacterized protein n=1 Tax=Rhizophagus irregularis TaxID=588596 RepID=A0A2N1N1N1_9GLOM|nr:hypothetical protein RhiirC2_783101 [Rhizophagus irregularis]